MKFRIEHTPQTIIDYDEYISKWYVYMRDAEEGIDYNFHPPEDQLGEWDHYLAELMEGIFTPVGDVTEQQVRAFLLSKGYEEIK